MIRTRFLDICVAQVKLTTSNFEDFFPILTLPLACITSIAILLNAGRAELASYGVVAATLMTIGQMGFFIGSELVVTDRNEQILELLMIAPTPYWLVLLIRISVLSAFGFLGFIESWILAYVIFGIEIVPQSPVDVLVTLLLTAGATAATSLITAGVFALARSVRTMQNAIASPLYLVAGVLVPTAYLPGLVSVFSPYIFLTWSAELLRHAIGTPSTVNTSFAIFALSLLGVIGGIIGAVLINRMLRRLRHTGGLGLV